MACNISAESAKPMMKTRPATDEDTNFIITTWLKSFEPTALHHEFAGKTLVEYTKTQHARIEAILPKSKTLIAFDDEFPDLAAGWLNHRGNVLNYIYRRFSLREHHVGLVLIQAVPDLKWCSHSTPDWHRFSIDHPLLFKPDLFQEQV